MRPNDVTKLLAAMVPVGYPVLLTGAPGVGKSDLVDQAAEYAKADLIVSHPVVADATEAKGLPWPKEGAKVATFIPFEDLYRAMNAKKPTIWFLDDIGQAAPAVQASFMQLLLARRANGKKLPDCLTFFAATNRRTDRAGVSGILEPVKSRFVTIISVDPNLDDWCQWAIRTNQPPELIAFLRFRPEFLHKFEPTLDLVNSPCPRTWAAVGKIIPLKLPANIELAAISGAVGAEAAADFTGFLRIYRDLPSLDAILADPTHAEIPIEPSALYAVSVGLAAKANPNNFARIKTYAQRLEQAQPISRGEFAVLMVRDSVRRNKKICDTTAYIEMMSTEIGKLISGEED